MEVSLVVVNAYFFCQNVDVFLQDSDVLMKLSKNQIFGPDC